jgi:hypothetical protein
MGVLRGALRGFRDHECVVFGGRSQRFLEIHFFRSSNIGCVRRLRLMLMLRDWDIVKLKLFGGNWELYWMDGISK